jgi:Lamin Tail Domain
MIVALVTPASAMPARAVDSTASSSSAAVHVNELAAGSTGFVELVNDSAATVDLGGWALGACTRGAAAPLAVLPAGLALDPGAFLLVVGSAFGGTVTTHMVVPRIDGSGVALRDVDGNLVDAVDSLESSDCVRGRPAPVCASGSTARDATSDDTLDNARDFACRPRTPGARNN